MPLKPAPIGLLLFCIALLFGCAQRKQAALVFPEDERWSAVDSLSGIGLYASARDLTEQILQDAMATDRWRTVFRATMHKAHFDHLTGKDAEDVITELEQFTASLDTTADIPLLQLMHSVLGQSYWELYQRDRWRILDRTNLSLPASEGDVRTWDQRRFMLQVITHFQASLQPFDTLSHFPTGDLGELLNWPLNADQPMPGQVYMGSGSFEEPLLIDLLALRALDVLRNSETRIAEPAWRFQLNDPRFFGVYEHFVQMQLAHRDSLSLEFQALRIWQQWERAHLSDDHPILLTDISLSRLAFVRDHSTLPEKDSLYYNALKTLASRVELLPIWSEVNVTMANWHVERSASYQRLGGDEFKWEKRNAVQLCDSAITRFPASLGAQNARALKARLQLASIDLQIEEAVLPGTPFKIALGYTNVDRVWIRIVEDEASMAADRRDAPERLIQLLQRAPIKQWQVDLPDDGDMNRHLVEVPAEGLPIGRYAILVGTSENMRVGEDIIAQAEFWSTEISCAERSTGEQIELLLLDRRTGKALNGASAELFIMDHRAGGEFISQGSFTADAEGRVRAPINASSVSTRWRIDLSNGDTFLTGVGHSWYHDQHYQADSIRTFLFTDRAIYRPGQQVFFKGITTVARDGSTAVKPGYTTSVKFFDANGQVVDSIAVTTDEFGAFHGLSLARSGLTGHMRIEERFGGTTFLVEEYVRPKFEVVFDTLRTAPKLDAMAEVSGKAMSYSGVPMDNAEVRWIVTRIARMPWWSHGYDRGFPGWGRPVEIASGSDTTNNEGGFQIEFLATADPQFSFRADPIFTFMIEASVTSISGETRIGTSSVNIGNKNIEIAIDLGEGLDRSMADSLGISVKGLNGQRITTPVGVRIHRKKAPTLPFRERLWERPDRFVIDSTAHSALFPFDIYDDEDDPSTWPADSLVMELTAWDPDQRKIPLLNVQDWTVGAYSIELITTDTDGNEVKVVKHFTIYDPWIQNTGFLQHAFHVEQLAPESGGQLQPGDKAKLLVSTALGEGRIGMEIEREGRIVVSRWMTLHREQQLVELPILEEDRGGFVVHFIAVANGRVFRSSQRIEVPWKNKELNIEWLSFRDKTLPGSKEELRLRITGDKGDVVTAQLLASMYDASLDHFVDHDWQMFQWPLYEARSSWTRIEPFGGAHAYVSTTDNKLLPQDTIRPYPELKLFGWEIHGGRYELMMMDASNQRGGVAMDGAPPPMAANEMAQQAIAEKSEASAEQIEAAQQVDQPVRKNFNETAFFMPDMLTESDGTVVLRFSMPEAITRWRLMGLAHTTDLKMARFDRELVTRKPMMVMPNLPRFLREGDRIELVSAIQIMGSDTIRGSIGLELFDPYTNSSVASKFGLETTSLNFTAAIGASERRSWSINVPHGMDLVGIRIIARNDQGMSDGEEHVLPILSDRMLVTESLPLPVSRAGVHTFTLKKLASDTSSTLRHQSLKLEFTPNPAWYAVQALPYLLDQPTECSEQVFSRFYANALAAHIVAQRPGIKEIVEAWGASAQKDGTGTTSALERSPELKAILLAETPWVMQARDESERKKRLALLFDMDRMASESAASMARLIEMQLPDGSWPWFKGLLPSRSITQHIVAGLGHLDRLGAIDIRREHMIQDMLDRAIRWMDLEAEKHYQRLVKDNDDEALRTHIPGFSEVHYLYARSFFMDRPFAPSAAQAAHFFRERMEAEWLRYGLQEQCMIALALNRSPGERSGTPMLILNSLRERATQHEELGMYWKNFNGGMEWWNLPTETHALAIEAFHEIAADQDAVNGLRKYLLKLKQTTDWRTSKATADACYALLLTGDDLLTEAPVPLIEVGSHMIAPDTVEAGTGYFTQSWQADSITTDMAQVKITTENDRLSWGALHWQYFEQLDRITPHESPFAIRKDVMLRRQNEDGPELIPIGEATILLPGDRLTIRIELRTDRHLDFVHLKDMRASATEPVELLSGPRWQGGLGYYQSIRDASMNFFFDRLPSGTHVFEYDLHVAHKGEFSNGITTAMCMYAPEFSSHSAGMRILVGE